MLSWHINAWLHCKILQKFSHKTPKMLQDAPYPIILQSYGKAAHYPVPQDDTPMLTPAGIKCIQQIVSSILYNVWAIDTIFMALSTITKKQAKATQHTMKNVLLFLTISSVIPMQPFGFIPPI